MSLGFEGGGEVTSAANDKLRSLLRWCWFICFSFLVFF